MSQITENRYCEQTCPFVRVSRLRNDVPDWANADGDGSGAIWFAGVRHRRRPVGFTTATVPKSVPQTPNRPPLRSFFGSIDYAQKLKPNDVLGPVQIHSVADQLSAIICAISRKFMKMRNEWSLEARSDDSEYILKL
ncbi:hypothetical protein L596_022554 [Steinernema carpocapsae]|uniref:Uncharacterized protein n=1 Tax=Steinernema carpocapsae TaxID=34508 RepID=A0A4U5MM33_STECR|nr:hypothetical protein L596_022554 [Steinernema carpocapsae]